MKKHLICTIAATLLSCIVIIAQDTLYRVEPGDTFESISRDFGISITELKEANPNVKTLFVGMKINIPKKTEEQAKHVNTLDSNKENKETVYNVPSGSRDIYGPADKPMVNTGSTYVRDSEVYTKAGGGMLFNNGEMVKKAFFLEYYLGSRTYPVNPIFFEYGLGYALDSSWANSKDYKYDVTTHSLQAPILLGVSLGDDIGTNFYFGPYVDLTLASKAETTIYGEKSTQRLRDIEDYNYFQLGIRFGGELNISGFIIGACYSIGLTSHLKGTEPSGGRLSIYLAF